MNVWDHPVKILKIAIQSGKEPKEYVSTIEKLEKKEYTALRDSIHSKMKYTARANHNKTLSELTGEEQEQDKELSFLTRWKNALKASASDT